MKNWISLGLLLLAIPSPAGVLDLKFYREINPATNKPTGKVCMYAYSENGDKYGNALISGGGGATSHELTKMGANWECMSSNQNDPEKAIKKIELASAKKIYGEDFYQSSPGGRDSGPAKSGTSVQ